MHNYTIAMEALINEIGGQVYRKDYWEHGDADRKFGPIKNSPVPFIPCQYHGILVPKLPNGNYPGGNLYPDKSWQGARITGSGSRKRTEYYGGFAVLKDNKGRCLIPDTPDNRKRLSLMAGGKKQVTETELFVDPSGTTRSRRVMRTMPAPAQYTMIQGEAAAGNLEAMINEAAERLIRSREEKAALPADKILDVAPARIVAAPGVVDLREPVAMPAPAPEAPVVEEVEDEQPDAPAAGGDGDVPPPAKPSLAPAPPAPPVRKVRGMTPPPPTGAIEEEF